MMMVYCITKASTRADTTAILEMLNLNTRTISTVISYIY